MEDKSTSEHDKSWNDFHRRRRRRHRQRSRWRRRKKEIMSQKTWESRGSNPTFFLLPFFFFFPRKETLLHSKAIRGMSISLPHSHSRCLPVCRLPDGLNEQGCQMQRWLITDFCWIVPWDDVRKMWKLNSSYSYTKNDRLPSVNPLPAGSRFTANESGLRCCRRRHRCCS